MLGWKTLVLRVSFISKGWTSSYSGTQGFDATFFSLLGASDQYEFFEGDILLTKKEMEAVKHGLGPNGAIGARGLSSYKDRLWPRGIVYYTISTSECNCAVRYSLPF